MIRKSILAYTLVLFFSLSPCGLFLADDGAGASSAKTPAVEKKEAANPAATPQPRAVFPEKKFQFKPVLEGERVKHTYKVVNKGQGDLKIEKVKTG